LTRHQRGFKQFTRPVFPSPATARMERAAAWAFPWASHPADQEPDNARQGRDRPSSTDLELPLNSHPSILHPVVHSFRATSRRTFHSNSETSVGPVFRNGWQSGTRARWPGGAVGGGVLQARVRRLAHGAAEPRLHVRAGARRRAPASLLVARCRFVAAVDRNPLGPRSEHKARRAPGAMRAMQSRECRARADPAAAVDARRLRELRDRRNGERLEASVRLRARPAASTKRGATQAPRCSCR
jgi:hypothetical protein